METQTQEAPEAKAPAFTLTPPRGVLKTGFPTDGFWVLAGLPKGGKTSLAASIPDALIIEMELNGADRMAGWIQDIGDDMKLFRQTLVAAIKEPKAKVIVIDTLDKVLDGLADEVAEQFGLESLSDRKEGVNGFAVWRELEKRVQGMVNNFKACRKLVIAISHFKEPKMDNEGKLVVTQSIHSPSQKASSYICSHADAIGVVGKKRFGDASQYTVKFHGEGVVGAYGTRIAELEDKTIILPKGKQWQAIVEAFNAAGKTPEDKAATTYLKKKQGGK